MMDCPHCGARIKVNQSGNIHCEYCDADIFSENSETDKSVSTEVNSEALKKWKRKRIIFIAVHCICVFFAWLIAMDKVTDTAMLFLIAGFSTFLVFSILLATSKPLSEAEKEKIKKGRAIFREYLVMLFFGMLAFIAGAIAGYAGNG